MREKLESYFSIIDDTRCQCDISYKLTDVLIIVMCAVLCNITKLVDILEFGEERIDFLKRNFGITEIPSASTICRIMSIIDAEILSLCIVDIMKDLYGTQGEIIAIDGKVIKSTEKMSSYNKSIHIMTAYLTENGVSLGQLAINEKTNEIPCMKELLNIIDIEGKIITADAMHCQKETIRKIIANKGDYVIQIKGNQGNTSEDIKLMFNDIKNSNIKEDREKIEEYEAAEKGHGRIERRICRVIKDVSWLYGKEEWEGLRSIFSVERIVEEKGKISYNESYYLSSLEPNAKKLLKTAREHWKVESMHWLLDVVMNEDSREIQSKNGQKAMNVFSKLAITAHKNYIANLPQKTKPTIKRNMLKCLLNPKNLEMILASL